MRTVTILTVATLVAVASTVAHADLWAGDGIRGWLCSGRTAAHCVDPADPTLSFHTLKSAAVGRFQEFVADLVRDPATAPQWFPESFRAALLFAHKTLPRNARLSDKDVLQHVVAQRDRIAPAAPRRARDASGYSFPYFGFLPRTLASVTPAGAAHTVSTECFEKVTISAAWASVNESAVLTIEAAGLKSLFCEDNLILASYGLGPSFTTVSAEGTTRHTLKAAPAGLNTAMRWFVDAKGIRVMRLNKSFLGSLIDVIESVTLMAGFGEKPLTNASFAANVNFMKHYIESSPRMQPLSRTRSAGSKVLHAMDEASINSGDGMVVVRYDGLDPMIGWGEGFTGGHSVIAMRDPVNGTLHVCESTASGAYWPVNGIQCTPWGLWFERAHAAQFNVLLAPLAPEYSSTFNATAAWAFFKEVEGFNYGYLNFLFGWLDVAKKNLPCLPPTYDYCLTDDMVEFIALLWDGTGNSPSNVFRQPLNHRLPGGSPTLPVGEVIMRAQRDHGMSFSDLYMVPEQDSWRYNTIRYGKPAVGRSLVCCVFVCNMWMRGGVFSAIDNKLQCGEQTLWDIFSMKIFDEKKLGANRPKVCKDADPENEQCQLIGSATFNAKPDFNTRPLYPKMGERCASETPDYIRAPGC